MNYPYHPHRMNCPQGAPTQDEHLTLQDTGKAGRHRVIQSHRVKLLRLWCHKEQVTLNSKENMDERSSVMQSITFSTEWLPEKTYRTQQNFSDRVPHSDQYSVPVKTWMILHLQYTQYRFFYKKHGVWPHNVLLLTHEAMMLMCELLVCCSLICKVVVLNYLNPTDLHPRAPPNSQTIWTGSR